MENAQTSCERRRTSSGYLIYVYLFEIVNMAHESS
jgi:hypothetical protein